LTRLPYCGMIRESVIRRLPEIAFALLFGGGLWLGGDAAVAGLPRVLNAMTPPAQASAPQSVAHLTLPPDFVQTRFAPQVLYPVTAAPLPLWLTEAMRNTKNSPPLRAEAAPRPAVIAICI